MRGLVSSPRLALTLRRLRSYFGIGAPKVAVRTEIPLYLRLAAAVLVAGVALAVAGWIYDAGRRIAGFDRSASQQEIDDLRDKVTRLASEAERLRGTAAASESNLQIERTTLEQLTAQVQALEAENAKLKEDLAVYENLAGGDTTAAGLVITKLRVDPDTVPGRYRFSMLAAQQGSLRGREFKGRMQVAVTLQQGNDSAIVLLPKAGDPDAAKFEVTLRNFRRLSGSFGVAPDAKVTRVEVRLIQDGAVRASQTVTF